MVKKTIQKTIYKNTIYKNTIYKNYLHKKKKKNFNYYPPSPAFSSVVPLRIILTPLAHKSRSIRN